MRLSIRTKLALGIIIPLLAIYSVLGVLDYIQMRRAAYDLVQRQVGDRATLQAQRINAEFLSVARAAQQSASFLTERSYWPDVGELFDLAEANVHVHPLVYASTIAFDTKVYRPDQPPLLIAVHRADDSAIVHDSTQDDFTYVATETPWFAPFKASGRAGWTEPYRKAIADSSGVISYSAPFRHLEQFAGVVVVDVRLSDVSSLVLPTGDSRDDEFGIISRDGTVLAHARGEWRLSKTLPGLAQEFARPDWTVVAQQMMTGRTGVTRITGLTDTTVDMMAYAPIESTGWSLYVSVSEQQIMSPVYAKLRQSAIVLAIGVLVIAGVVAFSALRIIAPLKRVSRAVSDIADGNLDGPPVPIVENDEIGELAADVNTMKRQLRLRIDEIARNKEERAKIETELGVAHQIQEALLPRTFPSDARYQVFARSLPARAVGGDFFDCFVGDDGRLRLLVADVSGKGIPAAIFMAVSRTVLRDLLLEGKRPGAALTLANTILQRDNDRCMFVTVFLIEYDPASGNVVFANAGHPPPIRVDARGVVETDFGKPGTLAGALEGASFDERRFTLERGQSLVLFSDGATDARQVGDPFGLERLRELTGTLGDHDAQSICAGVCAAIERFQGSDREDDLTVMVLKRV